MAEVLALQVDEASATLLGTEAALHGVRLRRLGAAQELGGALRDGGGTEVVVVGPRSEDPVQAAQQTFRHAARLPVLLLAERLRVPDLMRRLAVTPFISTDVRCLPMDDGPRVREALGHALARSRQRRRMRQVVAAANAQLARAVPPPLPVPAAEVLDRLLQVAPVGVMATDLGGQVRACNARAAALLGVAPGDAVGALLQQLLPGDGARAVLEEALGRAALAAGGPVEAALELPARPPALPSARHVELSAVRLTGHGPESGYLLVLQDATERVRLLEELREAVRVRDDFVAVAAHELNTPLTALTLLVSRLCALGARGPVAPEVLTARTAQLDRGVRRLSRLTQELLDVSRITAGRLELERGPVDLRRLAEEVLEQLAGAAAQAGCTLSLRGPEALSGCWDGVRLEQVLTNLVSNALKFGAGAPVEVALEAAPGGARLVVRDGGPGIPAQEQQRIFERFERAVSTRHHGGLGLGLWITRQIVHAHGGEVQVQSAPGAGATFTVTLPRAEPRPRPP